MKTEEQNPKTRNLDLLSSLEIVQLINEEDKKVALSVERALPRIAEAIDLIAERLEKGGRLFYIGAGTSGRLGILDAVECPPTFGTDPDLVQGILAGGFEALHQAVESDEDSPELGVVELQRIDVTAKDALVGLAASGRTPFTCGAIRYARARGCLTVGIACNKETWLSRESEVSIEVDTGPEVLTGSTRMKAGTAQKMILNMISTATMIRLGLVYDNLMVNVHLKNSKLVNRGINIVREITGASNEDAIQALEKAGDVRTAILVLKKGCSLKEAQALLERRRNLRSALAEDS